MPPRIHISPRVLPISSPSIQYLCQQCRCASLVSAITPAADIERDASPASSAPLIARYPTTQPPSYKPAEFRKTQLHRQYQSALRSAPLMILFQHNNLKALEWSGIRRELATALHKVDEDLASQGNNAYIAHSIKLQIVQTGIFASAMKVVEFWNPKFDAEESDVVTAPRPGQYKHKHGLSKSAWRKTNRMTSESGLDTLLSGPIAILTLPTVSPQHLKAALSILAPSPEFPAPKRKAVPTYHEPVVQSGLQKLLLLGARVEGKTFDTDGVKWVGSIPGGLDGLRAQLVAMLSGVGAGITNTLEAAGRTLYITVESRRSQLEEEQKPSESSSS